MIQVGKLLLGDDLAAGDGVSGDDEIELRVFLVQGFKQWQQGIDFTDRGAMKPGAVLSEVSNKQSRGVARSNVLRLLLSDFHRMCARMSGLRMIVNRR